METPFLPENNNSEKKIFDQVLNSLTKTDGDFSLKDLQDEAVIANRELVIHQEGLKRFYKLRDHWSWMLFGFIAASILFQIILTFFVGWTQNNFAGGYHKNFLYIVIGENFGQIVGMGYVVVRFLFNNNHLKNLKK